MRQGNLETGSSKGLFENWKVCSGCCCTVSIGSLPACFAALTVEKRTVGLETSKAGLRRMMEDSERLAD